METPGAPVVHVDVDPLRQGRRSRKRSVDDDVVAAVGGAGVAQDSAFAEPRCRALHRQRPPSEVGRADFVACAVVSSGRTRRLVSVSGARGGIADAARTLSMRWDAGCTGCPEVARAPISNQLMLYGEGWPSSARSRPHWLLPPGGAYRYLLRVH
jgi:hypothetical protein